MATETIELEKIISENLYSGLRATPLFDREPFATRVSWISWDSGFRDSGLRIEDLIVAVNGVKLELPKEQRERQVYVPRLIGQYSEYTGFALLPLSDGAPLTLTVLRRNRPGAGYKSLEIKGKVRQERVYYTPDGKRAIAPGGPEGLGRDGQDDAWSSWYDKRVWDWERYLDGRWMQGLESRAELKNHMQYKDRVDLALQKYPGEFSKRLKEDFDAVAACLQGELRPLPADALAFREATARLQQDVAAAGEKAWTAFLEKEKAETLDSIPRLDLIRDDRSGLTGKRVVVTGLNWRQAVMDGDKAILVADHSGTPCFVASDQPSLQKYQRIQYRYKTRVAPRVPDTFDLVGRIGDQPRMVVTRYGTSIGLNLEPLAVRVPNCVFVDVSGEAEAFAGEADIKLAEAAVPPDGASPSDVMRALVAAVKAGADQVWKSLYAEWTAMSGDGMPTYRPFNSYNIWQSDWERARNVILNKAVHVQPVWESDPRSIMTGKEFEGAPRIEEATVEMDHIDRFEDGDRVFANVYVHRVWTLQRLNGGPWRISSRNTI